MTAKLVARSVRTAHDSSSMPTVSGCRAQSARYASSRSWCNRQRQHGVVAIEFAFMFLIGMLPLLLLTFTGVMIFAAKQSLTLAAADGARAALQYPAPNTSAARTVAAQRMQWLLNFSKTAPAEAISVLPKPHCDSDPSVSCVTVIARYDYDSHPFLPGTTTMYGWLIGSKLKSSATIQLPAAVSSTP